MKQYTHIFMQMQNQKKKHLKKQKKILDDEGMPLYAKTFDREFKACRAEEL